MSWSISRELSCRVLLVSSVEKESLIAGKVELSASDDAPAGNERQNKMKMVVLLIMEIPK
ncbi:protein of unknown function [Xenorhabdus poinarii G6]|uniref:Uncharacterized protein n=1 Tax=Xenorhabdus poinarii G6 TaxID=1354304 RepID=A0A068QYY8_9GAMM|nr:protein of unknown function [Xenorhabdus poinarii G6]